MTAMGEAAKLRYLPPDDYAAEDLADDEARIMVRDAAGAWGDVPFTVEGSYLIFEISQEDEAFCLIRQNEASWLVYILIGSAVLILVGAVMIVTLCKQLKNRKAIVIGHSENKENE